MMPSPRHATASSAAILIAVLAVSILPLPRSLRSTLRQLRSPEPNLADREAHAGGYYLGLIEGTADSGRDELTLRLLGKTTNWKSFHEVDATTYLLDDILQFELKPDVNEAIFERAFTTNGDGLRDRPYTIAKPEGVFRIALLGSSMDMGWGVATDETYENRLEDWLNGHAAKRGIKRRFEVVNFAMAAYSPLHRLEIFRRKALAYRPDLVLYSATMLDARLLEIHIRNLVMQGIDPQYNFLRTELAGIKVTPEERRNDKDGIKAKVRPHLAAIGEATLADLANRCRAHNLPLAMIVVPRVGQADTPENRAPVVAGHGATARSLDIPFIDLSATFDDRDPAMIEIAPWDDHPNALGHKLLFQALARRIVGDPQLYEMIFGVDPPASSARAGR